MPNNPEQFEELRKKFTPDQLKKIDERAKELGADGLRKNENEWKELMSEITMLIDSGADPESEDAQKLAKRWMSLLTQFTGGDPDVKKTLAQSYSAGSVGPHVAGVGNAPNPQMFSFIQTAARVAGLEP